MRRNKMAKISLAVLIILFLLFSAASFVFIKVEFDKMFCRAEPRKYSGYLRYEDVCQDFEREELSFYSGKNKLQGYLYGAKNKKGIVVISHGMGGGAESYMAETLYFADHGYQVFGYDNTGCFLSEGKSCVGLSQSVIDLDAALTYIEGESRFDGLPVFLYGHSWGGYAVTAIFNYNHDITASASVAGFDKPMEMILEWTKDMMGGLAYVEQPYIRIYQQVLFGRNANMSAVDGINRTDTPVLIIHGAKDTTVGFGGAGIIAHKDRITNPNVQYKICEGEHQNDHNSLFLSLEAVTYIEELNTQLKQLDEQYDSEIPEEVLAEFYGKIDKAKTCELDEKFMGDVLAFYEGACD